MWQLILCFGFIFLIIEMFTPTMFFLSFALASFICAIVSLFTHNLVILALCFSVFSVILIFILRPLLSKNSKNNKLATGIEAKYIGKIAKAVENIDKNSGIISIYDERWQARNVEEGIIEKGDNVEIVGYESIVMKVKKYKEV